MLSIAYSVFSWKLAGLIRSGSIWKKSDIRWPVIRCMEKGDKNNPFRTEGHVYAHARLLIQNRRKRLVFKTPVPPEFKLILKNLK